MRFGRFYVPRNFLKEKYDLPAQKFNATVSTLKNVLESNCTVAWQLQAVSAKEVEENPSGEKWRDRRGQKDQYQRRLADGRS